MSSKINILLTSIGGELAPELINNLKSYPHAQVSLIGVDSNPSAIGKHFCDFFVEVPRGDSPDFLEAIKKVIIDYNLNLLIPGSDEEALAFSSIKNELENDLLNFACIDRDTLEILSSKADTYKALEKFDIPCAKWEIAKDFDHLKTVCLKFNKEYSEFVIKPSVSRGGRDVFVIRNDISNIEKYEGGREIHLPFNLFINDFINQFKNKSEIIVMERLFGPVHDLDMLAKNGDPIYIIPRRRVNSTYPNAGHTIVENPELSLIGEKIISSFNLTWLYDCDLMFDKNKKPKVIEINPRMSGSSAISIKAGIPLLHTVIDIFLKRKTHIIPTPYGTTVVPYKSLTRI